MWAIPSSAMTHNVSGLPNRPHRYASARKYSPTPSARQEFLPTPGPVGTERRAKRDAEPEALVLTAVRALDDSTHLARYRLFSVNQSPLEPLHLLK